MEAIEKIKQDFENITKFKIFEIEVIDKRTNEQDYIIFDISIDKDNFVAQHVPLCEEEEKSNKIAFKAIELDENFSLDENLQDLHEECTQSIIDSDFYELSE